MRRPKDIFIKCLYITIDVVCACLSIYLASYLRRATLPFSVTLGNLFVNQVNPFRFVFSFWILIAILFNHTHKLYYTKREIFESLEIWKVIKSVFLASLATITLIFLGKIQDFPRMIFGFSAVSMMFTFSVWRVIKRLWLMHLVRRGYNNFNALIVGAGRVGEALAREIAARPGLGIRIVGFLDDFKTQGPAGDRWKVMGRIPDFQQISRREFVNQVFITIYHDYQVFLKLLSQAKELGIAVRVIPQGFELTSGEFLKYDIGLIPILEYSDMRQLRKQAGKRIFDFFLSLIALVFLSPVFFLVALWVKCDSPGPVFYKSRRYGRGGRVFYMFKFRSMVSNAELLLETVRTRNEADGPLFKIRQDPRVTRAGRVLRKFSLDELPQLLNVLLGDMSLVGPRPLPIAQIEKEDLRQLKRLEVRPGITGLWQIRGRSDISFGKLLRWDIWYINNWSFWLDWNILLQTVPVVFRGRGAY